MDQDKDLVQVQVQDEDYEEDQDLKNSNKDQIAISSVDGATAQRYLLRVTIFQPAVEQLPFLGL